MLKESMTALCRSYAIKCYRRGLFYFAQCLPDCAVSGGENVLGVDDAASAGGLSGTGSPRTNKRYLSKQKKTAHHRQHYAFYAETASNNEH